MSAGFYHCSVKGVSRATGRSVVAAAAYRSGERLVDERTGLIADYQMRRGILDTFIMAPEAAPAWVQDRSQLWNGAEHAESRANGKLATELELALPSELNDEQRKKLLTDFVAPLIEKFGVAADIAIHEPGQQGDHRNHHAHVLMTHRMIDAEGFVEKEKGQRKDIGLSKLSEGAQAVKEIRQLWEIHVNRAYELAGLDVRVDHRSHADRGMEQEPMIHLGPEATAIERKGEQSELGDANREITARNAEREKQQETEKEPEPEIIYYDRDAAHAEWQDAIDAAAIQADEQRPQEAAEQTAQEQQPQEPAPIKEARQDNPFADICEVVSGEEMARDLEHIRKENQALAEFEDALLAARAAAQDAPSKEANQALAKMEAANAALADGQSAEETVRELKKTMPPPQLTGVQAIVAKALSSTMTGTEFAASIDSAGLTITRATEADVRAVTALREEAISLKFQYEQQRAELAPDPTEKILQAPTHIDALEVGDLAIVTRRGAVFRLDTRNIDAQEIEDRLADTQTQFPGVVEKREANFLQSETRAAEREKANQEWLESREAGRKSWDRSKLLHDVVNGAEHAVDVVFDQGARFFKGGFRAASTIAAKTADAIVGLLGFFGGGETPETEQQTKDRVRSETSLETEWQENFAADEKQRAATAQQVTETHAASQEAEYVSDIMARFGTPTITKETREQGRKEEWGQEIERDRY